MKKWFEIFPKVQGPKWESYVGQKGCFKLTKSQGQTDTKLHSESIKESERLVKTITASLEKNGKRFGYWKVNIDPYYNNPACANCKGGVVNLRVCDNGQLEMTVISAYGRKK